MRPACALAWLLALTACGAPTPAEAPAEKAAPAQAPAPSVVFEVTGQVRAPVGPTSSPYAAPLTDGERAARAQLLEVVRTYGLDPANPWAIGHALLALGPDATLRDGQAAVDHLFHAYAVRDPQGDVAFPKAVGAVRVEPHSGLTLKVLADLGVPPTRTVTVAGEEATVASLWRHTVREVATKATPPPKGMFNDLPWSLHGISTWASPGTAWRTTTSAGTLDGFTHAVVEQLQAETAFLAASQASGEPFLKRGQDVFAYTCGGAHLIQGAGAAVASGFGAASDRTAMREQADLQIYRFPLELQQLDAVLERAPQHALLLHIQRLKFTGHHLETLHRFAAWGLIPPDDARVSASLTAARRALVESVTALHAMGAFDQMTQVRAQREQSYLDLIGDSAHAVRGLDLGSGRVGVYR